VDDHLFQLGFAEPVVPGPGEVAAQVNSSPSLVLDTPEGPIVITGEAVNGQITSIWVRLNPDKTAALKDPPPIV
jgi:hypothetical protein